MGSQRVGHDWANSQQHEGTGLLSPWRSFQISNIWKTSSFGPVVQATLEMCARMPVTGLGSGGWVADTVVEFWNWSKLTTTYCPSHPSKLKTFRRFQSYKMVTSDGQWDCCLGEERLLLLLIPPSDQNTSLPNILHLPGDLPHQKILHWDAGVTHNPNYIPFFLVTLTVYSI